jgi:hypothetical protein
MGLGGPQNTAVDDAVKGAVARGVFFGVAAGNDGANACGHSPAAAGTTSGVDTVAATDSSDAEASSEQLRQLRRHLGSRRQHLLDVQEWRLCDALRDIDGDTACRGRRSFLPLLASDGGSGNGRECSSQRRDYDDQEEQGRPHDHPRVRRRVLARTTYDRNGGRREGRRPPRSPLRPAARAGPGSRASGRARSGCARSARSGHARG